MKNEFLVMTPWFKTLVISRQVQEIEDIGGSVELHLKYLEKNGNSYKWPKEKDFSWEPENHIKKTLNMEKVIQKDGESFIII